ncbi:MAG: hypothetical protein ACXITV_12460 [Luteibaculaceae bacterium]
MSKSYKILTVLILVFQSAFHFLLLAQSPAKFSYQAVIRNSDGNLLTNQSVGLRISILQGEDGELVLFEETHTSTTNANGLISLKIGLGTIIFGDLGSIDWSDGPFFIKVETDPSGGSDYVLEGQSELLSVPFAMYALQSENPGPAGEPGKGIEQAIVVNDSLLLTLSDNTIINAGRVKGLMGPQGDAGLNGISITSVSIENDSLFISLDNEFPVNIGRVKGEPGEIGLPGETGAEGIGVLTAEVVNDSLYITLTNGVTLNTGFVRGEPGEPAENLIPAGDAPGEILLWNGEQWQALLPGSPGQVLQIGANGLPQWSGAGYAIIENIEVSSIGAQTATVSALIAADGGSEVTEKGFVISTSPAPTLADETFIVGSGVGPISQVLDNLMIGQTYYVRAYAINSVGVIYSAQLQFSTNSTWQLGEIGPAGGFIFYDKGQYSDGWRYMEAAPVDQSTSVNWGCSGTLIPGSLPAAIGFGPANTAAIRGTCTSANTAAAVCDNYELNGFTDWFLPSRMELQLMHSNLNASAASFNTISAYWSSTQNNNISAQAVGWNLGNTIHQNKNTNYRVRAARRF